MFDEPGLRYSHQAMRTTFQFFFPGTSTTTLQGLAEDCANEITEIELAISPYQEGSDIQRLNLAAGSNEWIRIGWQTISLLRLCQSMMQATSGAFQPFDGYRTMSVPGKMLDEQTQYLMSRQQAAFLSNESAIEIHNDDPLARLCHGVLIDVGAIGKGWALDKCAEIILEAGIDRAFIHAGGSSMRAIGYDWPVRVAETGLTVPLSNTSMSVSRLINPDAGGVHIVTAASESAKVERTASVMGPKCAITDALSTAIIAGWQATSTEFPDYICNAVEIE